MQFVGSDVTCNLEDCVVEILSHLRQCSSYSTQIDIYNNNNDGDMDEDDINEYVWAVIFQWSH